MSNHTTAPEVVERAHAVLSASGAKKWLACTRSAREEEQFADEQSEFASEGTLAHELCELALLQYRDGKLPGGQNEPV